MEFSRMIGEAELDGAFAALYKSNHGEIAKQQITKLPELYQQPDYLGTGF